MKTQLFKVSEEHIDSDALKEAAKLIKSGGTVAFPTETVYGLGANALNPEAVNNIFKAKGRPNDNPLIVHIDKIEMLDELSPEVSEKAKKLANAFWPGPLTMILKRDKDIPDAVTAGLNTVGIRFPKNKIAQEFIKLSGVPIAAPSANLSGKPSPTQAEHVYEDLNGRVDGIILSEDSEVGIESTVINMTEEPPVILRPGIISKDEIESVIDFVALSEGITKGKVPENPASPGMKYKHYAPEANVLIVSGDKDTIREKITTFAEQSKEKNIVFTSLNDVNVYKNVSNLEAVRLGENPEEYAHNLFSYLRKSDASGIKNILVEQFTVNDKNLAVFDRLLHSSNYTFL